MLLCAGECGTAFLVVNMYGDGPCVTKCPLILPGKSGKLFVSSDGVFRRKISSTENYLRAFLACFVRCLPTFPLMEAKLGELTCFSQSR